MITQGENRLRVDLPHVKGVVAALVGRAADLAEVLALVEETGERYYEAEIHRLVGELLLMQGNEAEAETSIHQAIKVARRQQAGSWELRATTCLARLLQKQGREENAREDLAEIYGWFTEGFDTPDLREAKAQLDELTASFL